MSLRGNLETYVMKFIQNKDISLKYSSSIFAEKEIELSFKQITQKGIPYGVSIQKLMR